MRKLLSAILVCIFFNIQAQTPQEFSQPEVWLRADQFDENVDYWTDLSGNNFHAEPSDSFLLNTNGLINYNKAISFDGINDKLTIPFNTSNSTQLTIISVYHSKGTLTERGIWSTNINKDQDVMLSTQRAKGPQSIVKYSEGNMNFPVINTTSQFWGESTSGNPNTTITLGSGNPEDLDIQTFAGNIAEFMVFDRLVGGVELQILQSYLSIKYGAPLLFTDYLSSAGNVIWNFEENEEYSFSIAGIGRDDGFSLYQKQSSYTGEPDLLTIGVGEIAESNDANTSSISKSDFLLWGDNGKELKLEEISDEIYPYKLPVLDRKWLMSATGNLTYNLLTQIKLNVKDLLNDPPQCYLVIDKSGIGDFSGQNIIYVPANKISDDGYAYFDNIQWDTDKSGTDIFTFSFGMDNAVTCTSPNCFNEATGSINIEIQGGLPPYSLFLKNDSISYESNWNSDSRKYVIEDLSAGTYTLTVKDSDNNIANNNIIINNPEIFSLGLDDNYIIYLGESIELNAGLNIKDPTAAYVWESDNGFYSTDSKVTIYDPGEYTLTITNSSGCEANDVLTVTAPENTFYQYDLYPNPSNGDYKLKISLADISNISIRIFNSYGILIREEHVAQASSYKLDGYLNQSGLYLVEIETRYGKETFKLIVN
ncbi:MAG: T9SS type A sorting domain-containing protein [Bacteroidales bacterium]|nr:T9SS type A sorting domain-containing protein [Bacteroidales bacterium]